MLLHTERFIRWSNLDIKRTKFAAFYERVRGGNRWYKAKLDKLPSFTIMQAPIRLYDRHETYPYLGHKLNIAGDWEEQVTEFCQEYIHRITLIDSAPLPVHIKIEAIKQIALAKIQHLFHNVHISQQNLTTMNNKTVNLVRKWL
jgi:hypothetical protein